MQAARGFRLIFHLLLGFKPYAEVIGLNVSLFSSPGEACQKNKGSERLASLSQISRLLRKSGKQKSGLIHFFGTLIFSKTVKKSAMNSFFFPFGCYL
jgi:hypothetical protein